jgi:PAS domain S-box-containing protein
MQPAIQETHVLMSQEQEEIGRLFDLSVELLCVVGFDGYFKRLNPAWERTLGFSRDDLMSAPYLDFVHPDDRALTAAEAEKLTEGATTTSFESRYRCRDGSYKWLLWSAKPAIERSRIFASAHDITDRKGAELRLATSYAITRTLADSASLAQAAPRLLQCICETLGWEMGAFWQVAPDRKQLICSAVWQAEGLRKAGLVSFMDYASLGPGLGLPGRAWSENQPIWLRDVIADPNFSRAVAADESGLREAFAFPIRYSGEMTGVMEFFGKEIERPDQHLLYMFEAMGSQIGQFIERWRTEQLARDYAASLEESRREQEEVAGRLAQVVGEIDKARRDAEDGTRAKSEFLARMSHEIRTPMTAIMGMTELALGTPLTAEQREYLETVDESSKALLHLINDILDFSKIEAHRFELDHTDFPLRETVEGAVKTLAPRAREKRLRLACRIRKNLPDSLIGDPNRLRQILLNLLGNAIKFTDRGEIVVEVEREAAEPESVLLHFSVADTGIGVPPEMRSVIFDSFLQADTSITRRFGGTGLGLMIAAQLVAMMGGRMWLESGQSQGSIFHFTARFGAGRRRTDSRRIPPPAIFRGVPVLIADAHATSRRILIETLRGWGMKATGAASSEEALARAKTAAHSRKPFRVLLLAADPPRLNGTDPARCIRRLPHHRAASLILLTEVGNAAEPTLGSRPQAAICLTKPVAQSELHDAILASLQSEKQPARNRPSRASFATNPLSILIAEDNPVNQRLIQLLVEKMGHRAVIAHNGEEAISIARRRSVDLALMDVGMPVLSGLDATHAIRESEAATGAHLPIIAMTAHALKGDWECCLAAGMDAYLSKPIQFESLIEMIERFAPPAANPGVARDDAPSGRPKSKPRQTHARPRPTARAKSSRRK